MSYTDEQQHQIRSLHIRLNHFHESVAEWVSERNAQHACSLRVAADLLEVIQEQMGFELEEQVKIDRWRNRADLWIEQNRDTYAAYLNT